MLDIYVYDKYSVFMAKRKKKMGRPPKKARDVRSKPVTLRMIPADHKQLVKDARASGLSVSAYLETCWKKARE
jgi:predicted HicB family RNase H-like nuclease